MQQIKSSLLRRVCTHQRIRVGPGKVVDCIRILQRFESWLGAKKPLVGMPVAKYTLLVDLPCRVLARRYGTPM